MRSTRARVRSLYPALDEQGISALIETLGDNPRTELARRETEYAALDSELNQWVKAHTHPSSITFFYRQAGGMRACADQIRRCWRRETGSSFHFNIGVPVEMPALTADFSHIDHLKLVGVSVDSSTQTFLKNFSHVKTLKIINTQMTQLPDVVYEMSQLAHLDLSGNKIQLDAKGASTLSAFTHMQVLDLSQNPLGVLPDFAGMSQLKALNLRSTRIDQWPTGLVGKARLTSVDLSNNKLSEVPQAYLNPSPEQVEEVARLNKVTQLSGNPFPDDYWRVLDRYWQTLTQARPDLVADFDGYAFYLKNPLVEEASLLYNHYNVQDAREFVWGLGDGAQAELASRRLAFDQLQQQLNTWASAGGNQSTSSGAARYVRTAQRELNAADSDHRYIARTRILKCWRGDAPQETAADGTQIGIQLDLSGLTLPTLPELDADFSHVGSLKLTHMNLVASPEGMLRRFRNVRWLDLSNNQLRELPPALGEMHGLTRLFLHKNRLRLTPQTAQVLSERTSLRALSLSANRRIAKGEIVGIYGGVIMPDGFGLETANTFGVVVSPKPRPGTVGMSPNPTYLVGDTIISRINTHFDYDLDGKPVKQAASGYNVETVAFDIQAEHPASRPGKRTPYLLNVVFATEDIPAGVELRVDYGYSEEDIKIKFG